MLKFNKKYSGKVLIGHALDMGNKVSVGGIFVRLPLDKIAENGVYSFVKNNNGGVTIQHHRDSWSCDATTFNQIQTEGQRVLDNIFGDIIIDRTKNIK